MKETTTRIRKFIATDLDPLHRMINEAIDVSYCEIYPPRAIAFFKYHHSKEKIAERSIAGEIVVLVSEEDNVILATGSLTGSEIGGVFVSQVHKRKGYGKVIMTHLEQVAMERGIKKVSLNISLPSRQFYECLGYEVLGEFVHDLGEGEFLDYWKGEKVLR